VAFGGNGGGSDRELAVEVDGVGDTADVPDLRENASARVMDGCGDGLPGFGLLLGPDAGNLWVADAEGVDGCTFGEDEAGGGALRVVLGLNGGGDVIDGAAKAGKGRHEDAVRQVKVAEQDGV